MYLQVESLAISKDCFHCVAGCTDNNLYVYNLRTIELLDVYKGHTHPVTSVRIARDGHFVYSAAKVSVRIAPDVHFVNSAAEMNVRIAMGWSLCV